MFDTCTFVSHMSHPGAVEKMRFGRKLALQALGLASDPMEGVRRFFTPWYYILSYDRYKM